jgi:hypothetical protein
MSIGSSLKMSSRARVVVADERVVRQLDRRLPLRRELGEDLLADRLFDAGLERRAHAVVAALDLVAVEERRAGEHPVATQVGDEPVVLSRRDEVRVLLERLELPELSRDEPRLEAVQAWILRRCRRSA